MNFADIVGPVSEHMREEFNSSRIVHAYLFTGPAGTGKRALADICAQALLCQGDGTKPCGVCPSCLQYMSGNNPDLLTLTPEKDKKTIGVDLIRDNLIPWLSERPYQADRRVVLIPQADLMTPQAQNAFLKTLETPPGQDVIIMTTSLLQAILPTIVSRSRIVRFPRLSDDQAVRVLTKRGMPADTARLYAHLAQGSVGEAIRLSEDKSWQAMRRSVIGALESLPRGANFAYAAAPLSDKTAVSPAATLDELELCARDLMAIQDGGGRVIQTDIEDMLMRLPYSGSLMLQNVLTARALLKSNVQWQYIIEMLFLNTTGGTQWQP